MHWTRGQVQALSTLRIDKSNGHNPPTSSFPKLLSQPFHSLSNHSAYAVALASVLSIRAFALTQTKDQHLMASHGKRVESSDDLLHSASQFSVGDVNTVVKHCEVGSCRVTPPALDVFLYRDAKERLDDSSLGCRDRRIPSQSS
jgi:hypothetical protein